MLSGLFKREVKDSDLGRTQVARGVESGQVPLGCFGVRMGGDGLFTLHVPGEKCARDKDSRLYWVHPGPYELCFAPHPDAPEVGVRALLEAECQDERLARFLFDWDGGVLGIDALTVRARQIGGPHLLQPAMSQAEIDAKGGLLAGYSNDLQEYGFRCKALGRIDLGDRVSTEAALWRRILPAERTVETPSVPEDAQAPGVRVEAVELQETAELALRLGGIPDGDASGLPSWRLETLDRKLIASLDRELPWLARRLRNIRIDWSGTEERRRLRTVEEQLLRNARRVGLLPVLKSDIAGLRLERAEQRQRVAELRRAAAGLQQARLLVKRLEDAVDPQKEDLIGQLESVAWGMEGHVRRRAGASQRPSGYRVD